MHTLIRLRRAVAYSGSRKALAVLLGCGLVLVSYGSARAVSTSGSSFASHLNGTPASNTDTDTHSASGATSASSQSQSNVTTASLDSHAQSWATAKLVGGVLTKTASGKTWIEAGNNAKAGSWYSYSSGTTLQVNGADGPVELELIIRRSSTVNQSLDQSPSGFTSPTTIFDAHQSVYMDDLGTSTPASWNFLLDLKSNFSQGGAAQNLITGSAAITRGSNGFDLSSQTFNVLNNPVSVEVLRNVGTTTGGGIPRTEFDVPNDVAAKFTVQSNINFDVHTDLFTTMGFPQALGAGFDLANGAPITFTPEQLAALQATANPPRSAGAAGSFIVELHVLTAGYTLNITPEPSSFTLGVMGIAGIARLVLQRRSRQRSLRA